MGGFLGAPLVSPSAPPGWLEALLLGALQGVTEFLPVSSSAHLVLLPALLGWPYLGKAFDVAVHAGTLVALLIVLRDDLSRLLEAALALVRERRLASDPYRRLVLLMALGTVPVGLAGLLFEDFIERTFNHLASVALMLILWALVLGWCERTGARDRSLWSLGWRDALAVGSAQAAALLPGTSRSGSTIACGLWLGLTRQEAARFSFLLCVPVIAGATWLKAIHLAAPVTGPALVPVLVGMGAAAASGCLCIRWLLGFVARRSYRPFILYRVALGLALLAYLALGA